MPSGKPIRYKIGDRVGHFTIIGVDGFKRRNTSKWTCKCDCGNVVELDSNHLYGNYKKNCGCIKGKTEFVDLSGKRFGKLTVIKRAGWSKHKVILWLCKCDCGNETIKQGSHLRGGESVTCKVRGAHSKLGDGEGAFRQFYRSTMHNAKKRGLVFEIPIDDARHISKQKCFYCGCPPSSRVKGLANRNVGDYVYNGFDRVDNEGGYTLNNIVPCCKKCNGAKSRLSESEFRNLIVSVYHNWAKNIG